MSVFTSPAPGHSYARWQDSMKPVGHNGFLLDAKIMTVVLYHFLTDERFREIVKQEHRAMATWLEQYLTGLRETYADEIGH